MAARPGTKRFVPRGGRRIAAPTTVLSELTEHITVDQIAGG